MQFSYTNIFLVSLLLPAPPLLNNVAIEKEPGPQARKAAQYHSSPQTPNISPEDKGERGPLPTLEEITLLGAISIGGYLA